MFEKKVEELRHAHPELAAAYDMMASLNDKIDSADKSMSDTVGRATRFLKTGIERLHDGVRRSRGGDNKAEG